MNLHEIRLALHELRFLSRVASDRTASQRRIAVRWLEARQNVIYDRMIRLQMLEGVAGVPEKSWYPKDVKGLQLARAHFTETGDIDEIDKDSRKGWLAVGDTGTFGLLKGIIVTFVKGYTRGKTIEINLNPLDVIHDGLFGIPLNVKGHTNIVKLYGAGREMRSKILGGMETPQKAMAGMGSKGFTQIAQSEIAHVLRHRTIDRSLPGETGLLEGIKAKPLDPDDKWGILAAWILMPNDPVGKALRKVMRKSWEGWKSGEEGMNLWLNTFLKTKRAPTGIQMAENLGVNKGTWRTNYWLPGWGKFSKGLRSQARLVKAINDRFLGLGFTDVDISKDKIPTERDINPKRVKGIRQPTQVDL